MDEDGHATERFRLPDSFGGSNDPIDGNPYPTEHPAHQVWLDATRVARGEICRIDAEAHVGLTPETADQWMQTLVVAKFDVWARRGVQVVWTDQAERGYAVWLEDYANAWIDSMAGFFAAHTPPFPQDAILADLQRRLAARVQYWRSQAVGYRVQQEAHTATAPSAPPQPSTALVKRRRHALRKHRDAHGLTASGFAMSIGVSSTAVNGIVREDRTRFNDVTQEKLLRAIKMTRDEWYCE